jgi:hypothetical protein
LAVSSTGISSRQANPLRNFIMIGWIICISGDTANIFAESILLRKTPD